MGKIEATAFAQFHFALHGDQTGWRKKFSESITRAALTENVVTRMLTRDLFAIANLAAIAGLGEL